MDTALSSENSCKFEETLLSTEPVNCSSKSGVLDLVSDGAVATGV